MNVIDIKTEKFIKDIKDGNAVAFQMVMKKANGTIDIVCHGRPEDQALALLCLENHTKSKLFKEELG